MRESYRIKRFFKDTAPDYRNVIGFFTSNILKENKLISGFNILYPKVESFVKYKLFDLPVGTRHALSLQDPQALRNLSEVQPKHILYETFKKAIDALTITDKGTSEIRDLISLKNTKPKVADNQAFLIPKKSIFNKIIGDNAFELEFAAFCENRFNDVTAFAKNTMGEGGVNFKMEYQAEGGNIREYYPDFFVKTTANTFFIVETKGREDLDDIRKIKRLATWCIDVNAAQMEYTYTPIYIKQEDWDKRSKDLKSYADVCKIFKVK